jgi:PilZ domain-containing protein
MQERRKAERVRLDLPARWQSLLTQGSGSVCDLSATGGFLLTGGDVRPGELIRLEVDFGNHPVFLWGQVIYQIAEMGFSLRFIFHEENEQRALADLIERVRTASGSDRITHTGSG